MAGVSLGRRRTVGGSKRSLNIGLTGGVVGYAFLRAKQADGSYLSLLGKNADGSYTPLIGKVA